MALTVVHRGQPDLARGASPGRSMRSSDVSDQESDITAAFLYQKLLWFGIILFLRLLKKNQQNPLEIEVYSISMKTSNNQGQKNPPDTPLTKILISVKKKSIFCPKSSFTGEFWQFYEDSLMVRIPGGSLSLQLWQIWLIHLFLCQLKQVGIRLCQSHSSHTKSLAEQKSCCCLCCCDL